MVEPIQIVVVGGGFGGMYCARRLQRRLRGGDAEVTVVNPENYMLYTPLLPEAASGLVEPRHVVVPLRRVLGSARLRVGTVTDIDLDARTCTYRRPSGDEQVLSWDRLVLAPGSVSRLVPVPAWPSTPVVQEPPRGDLPSQPRPGATELPTPATTPRSAPCA